jgi:hypothetical protein
MHSPNICSVRTDSTIVDILCVFASLRENFLVCPLCSDLPGPLAELIQENRQNDNSAEDYLL